MAETVYKIIGESVELGIHMVDGDGNGLTGQSPTVEIRRLRDGHYLNFDTGNWATSGGTKERVLTAKSWLPSYYSWVFDHSVYEPTSPKEVYAVIYRNTGIYVVEGIEFYAFTFRWDETVEFLRKWFANKSILKRYDAAHWDVKHYEDDESTVFRTDDITVSGDEETRRPV